MTWGSTPPRPRSGRPRRPPGPARGPACTSNRWPRTHWSSIVASLRTRSPSIWNSVRDRERTRGGDASTSRFQRERLVEELEGQAGRRPLAQLLRQRGGQDPPQSLRGRRRHPQVRALRDSDGPGLLAGVDDREPFEGDPAFSAPGVRAAGLQEQAFLPAGPERLGHRDHQPLGRVRTWRTGPPSADRRAAAR